MKFRRIASTLLAGTIIATALPMSSAWASGTPSGAVTITIAGGNATALATCLNVAKSGGDIDQTNTCDNVATAVGGDVTIRNSTIVGVVDPATGAGAKTNQTNTVDVTIIGGGAKAVASCVNVVAAKHKGKKDRASVEQVNDCANDAFAQAGSVTLRHTRIIAVVKH
jgi:hypothetical protein